MVDSVTLTSESIGVCLFHFFWWDRQYSICIIQVFWQYVPYHSTNSFITIENVGLSLRQHGNSPCICYAYTVLPLFSRHIWTKLFCDIHPHYTRDHFSICLNFLFSFFLGGGGLREILSSIGGLKNSEHFGLITSLTASNIQTCITFLA